VIRINPKSEPMFHMYEMLEGVGSFASEFEIIFIIGEVDLYWFFILIIIRILIINKYYFIII